MLSKVLETLDLGQFRPVDSESELGIDLSCNAKKLSNLGYKVYGHSIHYNHTV